MVARSDNFEFEAVFENGVLRPVHPVSLPEHARFDVTVRARETLHGDAADKRRAWDRFFERADAMQFRSDGAYPSREQLHERR